MAMAYLAKSKKHASSHGTISPFDDASDVQYGIVPNLSMPSTVSPILPDVAKNVTGLATHIRDKNLARWRQKKKAMLDKADISPTPPDTPGDSAPSSDSHEHPHVAEDKIKKALQ